MDVYKTNPSTVFAQVEQALESQEKAVMASRTYEVDSLSRQKVDEAMRAMQDLDRMISSGQVGGDEWVAKKGKTLSLLKHFVDSPSLMNALASMQHLASLMITVKTTLQKDATNKVKATELETRDFMR